VRRGDLYRVYKPGGHDPKQYRTFVVVSRQALIDSKFPTVVCAPVFSNGQGLSTQVPVNTSEGLKHANWIMCDNLSSVRKADLTHYIGSLSRTKAGELNRAIKMALDLF
jgi:mRNA interferase MazF